MDIIIFLAALPFALATAFLLLALAYIALIHIILVPVKAGYSIGYALGLIKPERAR